MKDTQNPVPTTQAIATEFRRIMMDAAAQVLARTPQSQRGELVAYMLSQLDHVCPDEEMEPVLYYIRAAVDTRLHGGWS